MEKENDELLELEEEKTPQVEIDDVDERADLLTSSEEMDRKIQKLIDEKIAAAQTATDGEEPTIDDEDVKQGMGLFPMLLIGGIVVVGAFTLLNKNRPTSHPTESGEQNEG